MFICCGKKQKIEIANLRSQPLQSVKMQLQEDSIDAKFEFHLDKFQWKLIRDATGEELVRQQQKQKEKERLKLEQQQKLQKEDEELQRLQSQIEQQTFVQKEKKQLHDQLNDLFTKLKKDYLITQIKNELLKKMIEDDKKQMGEITNYEFAKS
ncbi:unnamed protein product (macronuclear) [Paramecium tetraurelia]|uniref:Uncharacterized protein n=2 Tax=Paramecium TaxID=5884 RepID=A0BZX5_PARTE|nr:uncharacterized protein GSPATT00005944001 [Paramecium tetraurelia]CAD8149220.1 unnamed protein product [Paramecium octaurelia]CAK64092.1 unnamed protein product [Paramecium tetraurelia]|eukprot:XP_001431490.1 hypothetical protein (macronuclear) [Paramecium tetraurelia strain d4-2]